VILGVIAIALIIFGLSFQSCVCDRITGSGNDNGDDTGIPSKTVAPYRIETYSRVYLAREAVTDEETGDVTMTDYWETVGKVWMETEGELVLEAESYGEIKVKKR